MDSQSKDEDLEQPHLEYFAQNMEKTKDEKMKSDGKRRNKQNLGDMDCE